jgi:mediator of RNA polymerase II transcription subunit 7
MDIEQDAELRNPFPSPPSLYQNYTNRNLELLELFQSRVEGDISEADQATLLEDQDDLPDWPLTSLEKPRVDWVVESGSYQSFGETWNVNQRRVFRLNVTHSM